MPAATGRRSEFDRCYGLKRVRRSTAIEFEKYQCASVDAVGVAAAVPPVPPVPLVPPSAALTTAGAVAALARATECCGVRCDCRMRCALQ